MARDIHIHGERERERDRVWPGGGHRSVPEEQVMNDAAVAAACRGDVERRFDIRARACECVYKTLSVGRTTGRRDTYANMGNG